MSSLDQCPKIFFVSLLIQKYSEVARWNVAHQFECSSDSEMVIECFDSEIDDFLLFLVQSFRIDNESVDIEISIELKYLYLVIRSISNVFA